MAPIKIAAGYVRCSTDTQDDSIEQQKRAIATWAKDHEYTIIEWFEDEGKSGTSFDKRPAFMRMVGRVETSPNFEYVLVYDESRWGRAGNPRESTYWKMHFERKGVRVRVINSQSKSENDIGSYVVEVVESAEASEYSKKLSRSTLRGCVDNASKGFSNGGTAPYGYKRIAVDKVTGRFIRELLPGDRRREAEEKVRWDLGDDLEVQTVRRIFELRVSGYGYRTIANMLNSELVPCPKRGRWRNKNQMWSSGTVQSIVMNPSYCGDRVYNRHPLSKKVKGECNVLGKTKEGWMSDPREWIVQRDVHPAIVTRSTFQKANPVEIRHERGLRNVHYHRSHYLLTGLVRCDRCRFNFQGQSYHRTGHFYYVDGGNMNKGKTVCERTSIRKEAARRVRYRARNGFNAVFEFRGSPRRDDETVPFRPRAGGTSSKPQQRRGFRRSTGRCRISLTRSRKESGLIRCSFGSRVWKVRRKAIEQERAKTPVTQVSFDPKEASSQVARFFVDFQKRFDKAPIEEKKAFLRRVVVGVRINPAERIARCTLTKIPMVNPALRSVLFPSGFVGRNCSGDLNLAALTTLDRLFRAAIREFAGRREKTSDQRSYLASTIYKPVHVCYAVAMVGVENRQAIMAIP